MTRQYRQLSDFKLPHVFRLNYWGQLLMLFEPLMTTAIEPLGLGLGVAWMSLSSPPSSNVDGETAQSSDQGRDRHRDTVRIENRSIGRVSARVRLQKQSLGMGSGFVLKSQ